MSGSINKMSRTGFSFFFLFIKYFIQTRTKEKTKQKKKTREKRKRRGCQNRVSDDESGHPSIWPIMFANYHVDALSSGGLRDSLRRLASSPLSVYDYYPCMSLFTLPFDLWTKMNKGVKIMWIERFLGLILYVNIYLI